MLVADGLLGTVDDDDLAARVEAEEGLTIVVDDDQRRRSRFRTTATDGTEVGVTVGRPLTDGDVLDADGRAVLVRLDSVEAMVIDLGSATGPLTDAVALGHAVGNRHWDLAVRDGAVLIPATERRDRMEQTVEEHLPAGATVRYEGADPSLFDEHSAFGGHGHNHGHEHDTHEHGHDHGHEHDTH